jgi:hypothetical protein
MALLGALGHGRGGFEQLEHMLRGLEHHHLSSKEKKQLHKAIEELEKRLKDMGQHGLLAEIMGLFKLAGLLEGHGLG